LAIRSLQGRLPRDARERSPGGEGIAVR